MKLRNITGLKVSSIISSFLLLISIATLFFGIYSLAPNLFNLSGPTSAQAAASWYNTSWKFRRAITVNPAKVTASLTNFPMLVNIASDTSLAANTQSTGNDIVFTDASGTKLSHEIEKYTSANGQLVAWVKVPTLTSSSAIYMYYGNATAANQQAATSVWDSNFKAVWHLNSLTADSTSNALTLANTGVTTTTGQIGSGGNFNGSSYLNPGNVTALKPASFITVECWVYLTANTNAQTCMGDANYPTNGFWMVVNNGKVLVELGTASGFKAYYQGTVALNNWYHLAFTYDGANIKTYINGVLAGAATPATGGIVNNTNNKTIGARGVSAPDNKLTGRIDEVRFSDAARSADWLATEYNNESSPTTFYTLGAE